MKLFTSSRRQGFTLIELMIVIIVIAILALIVIPAVAKASQRAKESTLRANLGIMRSAIQLYYADVNANPAALVDLVTKPTSNPPNWHGPYLNNVGQTINSTGVPRNPFIDSADTDVTHHWTYSAGTVSSAATGTTDGDNVSYTAL
jgi:type II secretion system protein G